MNTIELTGGTINHIVLHPESQTVVKSFGGGNGITRPDDIRLQAEVESLRKVKAAPLFKGLLDHSIAMSYIDGDREVDGMVTDAPDFLKVGIMKVAGSALRDVHSVTHAPIGDYKTRHFRRVQDHIGKVAHHLAQKGIDPGRVEDYLHDSYKDPEMEKHGLVWTHGDYWLNNLIGRQSDHQFDLNGIIDWELAGLASPYEDFAIVKMSIEDVHGEPSTHFWDGYGLQPDRELQTHFAIAKTLEWMTTDTPETSQDYESPFYQKKLDMLRGEL